MIGHGRLLSLRAHGFSKSTRGFYVYHKSNKRTKVDENAIIPQNLFQNAEALESHNGIPQNQRHNPRQDNTDIIHVKTILGHKNINNTMIYIHLEAMLFTSNADDFHVRVTATPKEIVKLLEAGFEYVCDHDGAKFFRKRK